MPTQYKSRKNSVLLSSILIASCLGSQMIYAADSNQNSAVLGQIAGAITGQGQTTATNPYGLSNTVPSYSNAQLQAMSCVDIELAENTINRDLQLRKQYASDLYEASKNAGTAKQQQYGALAGMVGGILAQRGGKNAQYGQVAQQIGDNMSGAATSQQLDAEIKNLQKLNAQVEDLKTVKRYKNCGVTSTNTSTNNSTTSTNTTTTGTVVVFNPANYPQGSVLITPTGQTLAFPKATQMRDNKGKLVTVYPEFNFPEGSKVRTPDGKQYLVKTATSAVTTSSTTNASIQISNPAIYPKGSVVVTPDGKKLALPKASQMRNSSGKLVTVYEEVNYPKGSYVRSTAGKRYTIR